MSEKYTRTVISALPGWYVALYCGGKISLDPIVAWEVERCETQYHPSAKRHPDDRCVSRHAEPITCGGDDWHDMANQWAIKTPIGGFEIPYIASFENETELLAHFREWEEKERAFFEQEEKRRAAEGGLSERKRED
jgi:hypothetical protein